MSIKHKLFLRWWLFISLVIIGTVYASGNGVFVRLWHADITKLSFLIISLFTIMSMWCGRLTWSMSKYSDHKKYDPLTVEDVGRQINIGWFVSELFFTIGMIGTVTGFIMMLGGFNEISFSDINASKELMRSLGGGMSTALYTTLTGLLCSVLLKIQYFNLSYEIERQT